MNDYIAAEINSNVQIILQQLRIKNNELQRLNSELRNLGNDAAAKGRKRREIENKKQEIESTFDQIFSPRAGEYYWMYRQQLFAAALNQLRKNCSEEEYQELTGKWRDRVVEKGKLNNNDALVIKSLASAGVRDFFDIHFKTPTVKRDDLPPYAFFLQFQFTLEKPYISRDDKVLYPVENPVRKDKIFGMPVIEAGSWKGNMRGTARKEIEMNAVLTKDKQDIQIRNLVRLFGNEKGDEENFRQGRLHFYPTFFEKISLEMINPHERKTKAGKLPVYIETVPAGAKGKFSLLYFPFDVVGLPSEDIKAELADDFARIPKAIHQMMRLYGFSAKKSSGFGVTGPQLEEGIMRSKHFTDDYTFSNFNQMEDGFKQLLQEVAAHVES